MNRLVSRVGACANLCLSAVTAAATTADSQQIDGILADENETVVACFHTGRRRSKTNHATLGNLCRTRRVVSLVDIPFRHSCWPSRKSKRTYNSMYVHSLFSVGGSGNS